MLDRNLCQNRELSATSQPITEEAESMPVMPCASMFDSYHWPEYEKSREKNSQTVYNCIQYELSDGAHVVISADAKGILLEQDKMSTFHWKKTQME